MTRTRYCKVCFPQLAVFREHSISWCTLLKEVTLLVLMWTGCIVMKLRTTRGLQCTQDLQTGSKDKDNQNSLNATLEVFQEEEAQCVRLNWTNNMMCVICIDTLKLLFPELWYHLFGKLWLIFVIHFVLSLHQAVSWCVSNVSNANDR